MNRASLLLLAAALVLLGAAAYVWRTSGGGGDIALPSLDLAIGPLASATMAGLLAGFVGAAIANRFNIGRRGYDTRVAHDIAALKRARQTSEQGPLSRASPPPAPEPRPAEPRTDAYWPPSGEPERQPDWKDAEDWSAPKWPSPPPPPPPRPSPQPAAIPNLNLNEISAAYNRIVSGQISRSAFADFFASIGKAGPVDIADGGRSIESSGAESFLTSVCAGSVWLIFPSYDFIANQATQFATIASVPENVAAVFAVERGDGELILDRPAIYEDSETGLRLVSKGEIRGFGG